MGWIGLAVVAAVFLVVLGRHEGRNEESAALSHIAAVRAAIGPSLARPAPDDYLVENGLMCLLYAVGQREYALELCTDASGRVVEATDRRGPTTKIYSIRPTPGLARISISPAFVLGEIARLKRAHHLP